jgi:hypothetical protein
LRAVKAGIGAAERKEPDILGRWMGLQLGEDEPSIRCWLSETSRDQIRKTTRKIKLEIRASQRRAILAE